MFPYLIRYESEADLLSMERIEINQVFIDTCTNEKMEYALLERYLCQCTRISIVRI